MAGWVLAPDADYTHAHQAILATNEWIIEGLGTKESISRRIKRATHIILCDFPIWQNFWLLAERQSRWHDGQIELPPGDQCTAPPTRALFETVWTVETEWMPDIRSLVRRAAASKPVQTISSVEALQDFTFAPA